MIYYAWSTLPSFRAKQPGSRRKKTKRLVHESKGGLVVSGACSWCRIRKFAQLALISAGFLVGAASASPIELSNAPPKRVLLLYSFDNEQGIYSGFDRVVRSQLRLRVRDGLEFYTEYLDLIRFPSEAHAHETVRLLQQKYTSRRPDLIIPVSFAALQFLLHEGKDLFPQAPLVTLFSERRIDEFRTIAASSGRSITGVSSSDDAAGTLQLALQLQPDAGRVTVVIGNSPVEQYWRNELKKDLAPYASRVQIQYLNGLSIEELIRHVSELPPHSIILTTFFFQDATGQFFFTEEVLDLIASHAHVPNYGIYFSYIGHGVVGGRMTNSAVTGRKVADLAAAVLNGENGARIPIVTDDAPENTVDWREMQRWGLSEKAIPSGTVELFRQPSLWERYRPFVLAVITLTVLQTLLILGLIFNVRRRKRAEKALQQEKAIAETVIESLPGLFVLQDQAGNNVRWNRNAESITRYGLTGIKPLSNIAESQREDARMALREAFERGSGRREADLLLKDDKTAPYYFTCTRVELQGKPYVAAIGMDLTERKQAQQALDQSVQEVRSFVEHAPYGIATINVQEDRFLHANPAMVKLLGCKSENEVLALSLTKDLYPDGNAQSLCAQVTRADFFSAVEFIWKRKDGKAVNVRASGRRISPDHDGVDLIEIIAEDVTARRQLEEQLRHAQKMEALGQLSGSVAHDFNNLLSVIIGYSELLSSNPASDGPMRAHLQTIKRAGERAASLTAQLLAFSRRQVLQPSVVNLNLLVKETEKMLRRLMREDIEQRILLDPALWKTKADPNQIVQVIINLAINAGDAMPKRGTLTIETANMTFDEPASFRQVEVPAGRYVKLAVSDTGIGMDAQTQARIFEPFFTTKEAGKGTGLGLATVYGIVKQSGGYVFVDSELGKGTTLTIFFPKLEQASEATATTVARPNQSGKLQRPPAETLLVVEDEAAFRDLLRDGLTARGYNVLVACNGVHALQVTEEHNGPIRVLITDVIMPQMSGPELASALRKIRPEIDVIYISGYTNDRLRNDDTGSELTLIHKPFYINELAEKLEEILARKHKEKREVKSIERDLPARP